jgi:hypothetical protein
MPINKTGCLLAVALATPGKITVFVNSYEQEIEKKSQ